MKSNFFFANSAVSSIFLTPVSKLISLREELVNKLDMIDVVCVLSSRDPEADSRLYDTLLLTRDLVGYIEQEINRRYLKEPVPSPKTTTTSFFGKTWTTFFMKKAFFAIWTAHRWKSPCRCRRSAYASALR